MQHAYGRQFDYLRLVSFPRHVSLTLTKTQVRESKEKDKLNGQEGKKTRRCETHGHSYGDTTVAGEVSTLRDFNPADIKKRVKCII